MEMTEVRQLGRGGMGGNGWGVEVDGGWKWMWGLSIRMEVTKE